MMENLPVRSDKITVVIYARLGGTDRVDCTTAGLSSLLSEPSFGSLSPSRPRPAGIGCTLTPSIVPRPERTISLALGKTPPDGQCVLDRFPMSAPLVQPAGIHGSGHDTGRDKAKDGQSSIVRAECLLVSPQVSVPHVPQRLAIAFRVCSVACIANRDAKVTPRGVLRCFRRRACHPVVARRDASR